MLEKLKKLYFPLFHVLIFFNLFISACLMLPFWMYGFGVYVIYMIALLVKGLGYGLTIVTEKLFNTDRKHFLYNLGLSYRYVFAFIFLLDFGYLIVMLTLCSVFRAFM